MEQQSKMDKLQKIIDNQQKMLVKMDKIIKADRQLIEKLSQQKEKEYIPYYPSYPQDPWYVGYDKPWYYKYPWHPSTTDGSSFKSEGPGIPCWQSSTTNKGDNIDNNDNTTTLTWKTSSACTNIFDTQSDDIKCSTCSN